MDIKKQIDYWIDNAFIDIESAELLISNGKYLHGLFFCHLTIEKALKAHVVKYTEDFPPKSHNLLLLAKRGNIELSDELKEFLGMLMIYQLEGRYPDYNPAIPELKIVKEYLNQTRIKLKWLKETL